MTAAHKRRPNESGSKTARRGKRQMENPVFSPSRPPGLFIPTSICLALVAACLLVYSSLGGNEFVTYDDPTYITENPHIIHGLRAEDIGWAFSLAGHGGNWHPLTSMSHMLDVEMFGLTAGPHHLVNLSIHILNSMLLFLVLFQMTGVKGNS